ncbi:uncharacterized protein A4U43_C01F13350 [Asparagus officinalis]|uniref:RBR-type E3 ubiquitin transferase n=1 Tax=Asparagus officinalis TaxID=4686 RepID=A0A5P1FP20_ASPOF|nr:probable E3 ubiquitin-protein ligase ARI8 [Asparagus officinalis]ONK80056.1 uncharacterized protein A4U43_C01F13350 [Asparagus officinalis]
MDFLKIEEEDDASIDQGYIDHYFNDCIPDVNCNNLSTSREENYTIMSEGCIRKIQEDDIQKLSETLCISPSDSCTLLLHFNWNIDKVYEGWFTQEEEVRISTGLFQNPFEIDNNARKINCRICFEIFSLSETIAASCGHRFCIDCYRNYVSVSLSDNGLGCLNLRCPDPSCTASIGQDIVESLVSEDYALKYSHFLIRSYVESKKNVKWCPAPGCYFAVSLVANINKNSSVHCRCGHAFCWNCAEEAHRPVDCETFTKWISKNGAEYESKMWILANSMPCPKCKRPIEKDNGCMHMTCLPPCKFEFCWLCHESWLEHSVCRYYAADNRRGTYNKEEHRDEHEYYFKLWALNRISMIKAISELKMMPTEKMGVLYFFVEAWEQIVECRRILAWTYAYGYYLAEEEKVKKELFEYLQSEAEANLEELHKCAKIDLQAYLNSGNMRTFAEFQCKLSGLTLVTRNYFDNFVHALENGLKEVDSRKAMVNKRDGENIDPYGGGITSQDYMDEDGR